MDSSLITLMIAVVAIVIAWKVFKGVVKFGLIVLVALGSYYFLSQGGYA